MKLNATALIRSAIGVIWLVVALTIGAELSAPFKAYLTELADHHWVAKSLIALVAFDLLYLLQRKSSESQDLLKSVISLSVSVVLGGLAIFGFYVWHFLQG